MNLKKHILIGLLSFVCIACIGQVEFPVIDSITFEGIKKNKPVYLSIFVEHKVGQPLDTTLLNREVQTLQNLPSLFYVTAEVKKLANKNVLVFKCEEAHTLLPFVFFGGGENEESLTFQIGGAEYNLLGRGIQTYGYYQFKEKHSFVLSMRNQFLFNSDWGAAFTGKKLSTNEPLYFDSESVRYQFDNYYLEVTGIRSFRFNHYLEFGGAIFSEHYNKLDGENIELGPQSIIKAKYLGKLYYYQNNINYFYHFRSGSLFSTGYSNVVTEGEDVIFQMLDINAQYHKRIAKRGMASFRLGAGISTNNDSPFAAFLLDSQTNLRGIGDRVTRGTGVAYFNSEYHHTLLDREWLAIMGTVFSDHGWIRNPGTTDQELSLEDNYHAFGGIGSRFILKKIYNAVLRLDFGHSLFQNQQNEIVIGLGHYF